jgi:putative SOS response-associated peptidase YedK
MCGKFTTQMLDWGTLASLAEMRVVFGGPVETVTPMRFATVIRLNDEDVRETARMRWGFARMSANDPVARPDHIHARAETIDSKPTFRESFEQRRGLLIVKTFNEGEEIGPRKTLQYTITPRDGQPLAIAVIWERWVNAKDDELLTFVMVTTPANALIGKITDRMPAVMPESNWPKWLGEEPATAEELKALLQPCDGDWDMQSEKKANPTPPKKPSPQLDLF